MKGNFKFNYANALFYVCLYVLTFLSPFSKIECPVCKLQQISFELWEIFWESGIFIKPIDIKGLSEFVHQCLTFLQYKM